MAVQTGDYVVGDSDGVVIIPQQDVEKIIEAAEAKVAKDEERAQEALHNGEASIRAYLAKVVK